MARRYARKWSRVMPVEVQRPSVAAAAPKMVMPVSVSLSISFSSSVNVVAGCGQHKSRIRRPSTLRPAPGTPTAKSRAKT